MWRARNFWQFLQRLWRWLPILWQDRDWDHAYILIIWRFKLQQVREHLDSKGVEQRCTLDKKLHNIRTVELLLSRMLEDGNSLKGIYSNKAHERQDYELMAHILNRHLTTWWD